MYEGSSAEISPFLSDKQRLRELKTEETSFLFKGLLGSVVVPQHLADYLDTILHTELKLCIKYLQHGRHCT